MDSQGSRRKLTPIKKGMTKPSKKLKPFINISPSKIANEAASKVKATWDTHSHAIFIDLCLKEIRAGNRPNTHFSPLRWMNIAAGFSHATGKKFTRIQLKNHWDSMKRDWTNYKLLMRQETSLGWNPDKGTIDATNAWWDEKIQMNQNFAFRDKNLEQYKNYDALFMDVVATGERAWGATQGLNPASQSSHRSSFVDVEEEFDDENEVEGENQEDDEVDSFENAMNVNLEDDVIRGDEDLFPPPIKKKKKKNETTPNCSKTTSRSHVSSAAQMKESLSQMVDLLCTKSNTGSSYSLEPLPPLPPPVPTVADCITLLHNILGAKDDMYFWNEACTLFWKKEAREAFVCQDSDEDRRSYLEHVIAMKKDATTFGRPPSYG